jgi:hypothetical protein
MVEPGTVETGDHLDIQGWVTIENRCGSTFDDAGIKLIAGDVNREPDPWAPPPFSSMSQRFLQYSLMDDSTVTSALLGAELVPEFVEKSFFEYHLYTLSVPSTVRDRQIKQLKLLRSSDIKAKRLYIFDTHKGPNWIDAELEFENSEDNQMGMPLPKGNVRMMQIDADGDAQLIGQCEIDHTPRDEDVTLTIGRVFDVTAGLTVVDVKRPASNREIQTIRLIMRNHKDQAIRARCVGRLTPNRNWTITESTDPWTREDANTVHFDFVLGPNEEKQITSTVDYTW